MVLSEGETCSAGSDQSLYKGGRKINVPTSQDEAPPSYNVSQDQQRQHELEEKQAMILHHHDDHQFNNKAQEKGANFIPYGCSNVIVGIDIDHENEENCIKCITKDDGEEEDSEDHWSLDDSDIEDTIAWKELTTKDKIMRLMLWILKPVVVLTLLYFFICSLDLMSAAFRLLGGKTAGEALAENDLLGNPVCGLMLGILVTVLVQSSSTSTSIIVSMVASELLPVQPAIFIIMGANIGTSVTNTIVSIAQCGDKNQFRRAFGGATVHDMFNWLAVIILLPIEAVSGYLFHLSTWIVNQFNIQSNEDANVELLKVLTKPFTKMIIQIDSKVLNKISTGELEADETSLLKEWCQKIKIPINATDLNSTASNVTLYKEVGSYKCHYLFANTDLSEVAIGSILLVVSLILLCACLILLVKLLNSMLRGHVAIIIRKTLNANLPGKLSFLTGYLAILIGAVMTFIVQSSSVFTSALTPLVGMGVIKLERMYPLTLGSNIGTTATGILAALACSTGNFESALQIAMCHLLFNVSGILIWYPLPFMRQVPIYVAKCLGNTTAKYRWFAIFYLITMFFLLPGLVFALSLAGLTVFLIVGIVFICVVISIVLINIMQHKCPHCLPSFLRTWNKFPKCMHSLQPLDNLINKVFGICCICKSMCAEKNNSVPQSDTTAVRIIEFNESQVHFSISNEPSDKCFV